MAAAHISSCLAGPEDNEKSSLKNNILSAFFSGDHDQWRGLNRLPDRMGLT
jgi:hypothetical protein